MNKDESSENVAPEPDEHDPSEGEPTEEAEDAEGKATFKRGEHVVTLDDILRQADEATADEPEGARHSIDVERLNVTQEQLERMHRIVSQPWVQDYAASHIATSGITDVLRRMKSNLSDIYPSPGVAAAVEAMRKAATIDLPRPTGMQGVRGLLDDLQLKQQKLSEHFAAAFVRDIGRLARNAALAGYARKTQEFLTTTESLRYRWNRPVWHYTNGYALMSILRNKCLWASNPAHLNDATEIRHGFEFLQEAHWKTHEEAPSQDGHDADQWEAVNAVLRQVLNEDYFSDIINEVYLISASAKPDSLTLWRNYADGDGFAIGIDTAVELSADGLEVEETSHDDHDPNDIPPISGWYRVEYKDSQKRRLANEFIESAVTDILAAGKSNVSAVVSELRKQAVILASVMKHEAFQDEREVRWISTNFSEDFDPIHYEHGRKSIVPVLHVMTASEIRDDLLPLKGVWCSPIADDSIVRTIEGLLRQNHYDEASEKVEKSVQPFRG